MQQIETSMPAPSRRVVLKGPSVGRYLDHDIPSWIESGDGARHEYSHILQSEGFKRLGPTESVIHPGLVYKTIQ
jgi:hypothetical protein